MTHLLRSGLGGRAPGGRGCALLSLLLMSDVQVMDTLSPARCEWVELLAHDPRWQPLLHMHRPYEALTHWALAADVERVRRTPIAPWGQRACDLCVSLGDNIDNAQHNEQDAFLSILCGSRAQLSARGGVHEASGDLGSGPWPYWCPDAGVDDLWKPQGYPAVPDFVPRASAELVSQGLGFAWASLPGNHDLMRQGAALPEPEIERIKIRQHQALRRPEGFDPPDPLTLLVNQPAAFSRGGTRTVRALETGRALNKHDWVAAQVAHGAAGYSAAHARDGNIDAVNDTEHVRIILLDTNHPAGDFEDSLGANQLDWLNARLAEVDAQPGPTGPLGGAGQPPWLGVAHQHTRC